MPVREGVEGADLLLRLLAKPETADARQALAACILGVGGVPEWKLAVESHGHMASLAVFDGDDWVISFAPAARWVLGYVRPPFVRRNGFAVSSLTECLPHAQDRGDEHFTARLHDHQEAEVFLDAMLAHGGKAFDASRPNGQRRTAT